MLTISGKTLGKKKPLFADWSLPIPPEAREGGALTLRELLERIVRHEVAAFQQRQEQRQTLRALTSREIEAGATQGKIAMGGQEFKQDVDPEQAVAAALEAFTDGLYLVVIDGVEQRDLDQQLFLRDESTITFIRLTMLAGG